MIINDLSLMYLMIKVTERDLNQSEVANNLCVRLRKIKQVLKKYRSDRAKDLISKKRGAPSKHHLPNGLNELSIDLLVTKYNRSLSKLAFLQKIDGTCAKKV